VTAAAHRWHQQQIRRGTAPARSGSRRGTVLKGAAAKLSKKTDPRRSHTTKLSKRTDLRRGCTTNSARELDPSRVAPKTQQENDPRREPHPIPARE
jgi:hypothetical protein